MAEYHRPHDPFTPPGSRVGADGPPYARGWEAGGQWIDAAFRQFQVAPLTWIGITVLYLGLQAVMAPFPFAFALLSPVLLAGLVLGCAGSARTGTITLGALFSGFSHPMVGRLIGLGLLSIVAYLLAFIVIFILGAVLFGAALMTADGGAIDAISNGDPDAALSVLQMLAGAWPSLMVLMTVSVTIFFALGAALWLAPARIVLAGASITDAMADSFSACLRSWRALTLFGLGMFGLGILAMLPFGLGLLVFIPMTFASQYIVHEATFGNASFGGYRTVAPPPPPPPGR